MGVNICVFEYDEAGKRASLADVRWFDTCRHVGDRDFVCAELPREYSEFDDDEPIWRPTDFETWRAWVHAYDFGDAHGNRARLLELLDRLEANPRLWIDVSW